MKKLDSHAAGLKLAAMAAKSLALLPAACMICSIYSQTNSLSMLVSYLIALPLWRWDISFIIMIPCSIRKTALG